jgi:hypothetical protein
MLWNYKPVILGLCPNMKSLPISVDVCVIIFNILSEWWRESHFPTISFESLVSFSFCFGWLIHKRVLYTFSFRRPDARQMVDRFTADA